MEESTTYRHDYHIDHVIFDNDGTLYHEPPDVKDKHMLAAIQALQPKFPDASNAEIHEMIKKSQREYKSSFGMFVAHILDPLLRELEMARLRDLHYDNLAALAVKGFFDESASPYAEIGKLRIAGVNVHIGTHGNLQWTKFSVEKNGGLSRYFNECNIFTKDEAHCRGKNEGPYFYNKMLDKIGIPDTEQRGKNCAMVEDSVTNLIEAKAQGMMTILISDTVTAETKPDYVDVVVRDAKEAIEAINASNLQIEQGAALTQQNARTNKPNGASHDAV